MYNLSLLITTIKKISRTATGALEKIEKEICGVFDLRVYIQIYGFNFWFIFKISGFSFWPTHYQIKHTSPQADQP